MADLLNRSVVARLRPGGDRRRDDVVEGKQVHRIVRLVADRDCQPMAAQYKDALVGSARGPGGVGWQIGELAVGIGAEARRIAGPGMGRGKRVVGFAGTTFCDGQFVDRCRRFAGLAIMIRPGPMPSGAASR